MKYRQHREEVALTFQRYIEDRDLLRYLMKLYLLLEEKNDLDLYKNLYRYRRNTRWMRDNYLFDVQHFYPTFLIRYDSREGSYINLSLREKIKIIETLNKNETTIRFRQKSIQLFQRIIASFRFCLSDQ
jgi:hypothetical protein